MVDPRKASIREGDILFNNTNSQELVGKTCLVDRDYDYGFSNHITRIRLKDGIVPGFVVFYLTLLRNSGYFARLCTRWINQAAINTDTLKEQSIPVPPLAEQKFIVAKVDELMALCDRLEAQLADRDVLHTALTRASLARVIDEPSQANLDYLFHAGYAVEPRDLRRVILDLAFQGRLTSQVADDGIPEEPPEVPDSRRWGFESLQLPALPRMPDSWRLMRIGDMVADLVGGVSTSKSDYVSEGVLVFNKGNVRAFGNTAFDSDRNYVSEEYFLHHEDRAVRTGDMVVALRDFSVKADFLGLIGQYSLAQPALLSQGACVVRPCFGLLGRYLMLFSNSTFYRQVVKANKIGSTQVHLRNGQFGGIPIPVPPLAEQRRIVERVDQLMSLVDELEAQLAASRSAGTNLLGAVVAELTADA